LHSSVGFPEVIITVVLSLFLFFIHLFTCLYIVWVISTPAPTTWCLI
jgi:hypothetical protein